MKASTIDDRLPFGAKVSIYLSLQATGPPFPPRRCHVSTPYLTAQLNPSHPIPRAYSLVCSVQ